MFLALSTIDEALPGHKWQTLFQRYWPNYEKWYLSEGYMARPGYLTCYEALEIYMPQIVPLYEKLCELAGGGDLPARFLSLYNPPPYLSGCSQLAWTKGRNVLIRNYDYSSKLFDGIFLKTNWLKPVIAMTDCMWGVLDGMNADGLAVSLSFGGRKVYGNGFGIPIILRYVLETCSTVLEAKNVLLSVPIHMQYNVTLIDKSGQVATAFLAPDRPAEISLNPFATNHQHYVEWEEYGQMTKTVVREQFLREILWDNSETYYSMMSKFFKPPLYNTEFLKGFGTLYTSIYKPNERKVELLWPQKRIVLGFENFEERNHIINLSEGVRGKFTH